MNNVIAMPEIVDDSGDVLLADVVQQAITRGLRLVIDRHGRCVLTPMMLPGMREICVVDKAMAA
jgi:hypothetical protein